jgi:lysophospholipase L1-like esterase
VSFATIYDDPLPTKTNVALNLLTTDANGDNTIASYTIETLPRNGTIAGCATVPCSLPIGAVTYVPNDNSTGRHGLDSFTFHVTDQTNLVSGAATAWILNSGNIRIMPLGDSITAGVADADNPPTADRIGFRKDLYDNLTALSAGQYGIDFVGSQFDGANYPFDHDHEGRPGWCTDNHAGSCAGYDGVAENVEGFLDTHPADVVLLHIGTNAFSATYTTGVKTILDNIEVWAQNNYAVTVMVARIIPTTDGHLEVNAFNNAVAGIAYNRPHVTVHMVDLQGEFNDPNFVDPSCVAVSNHANCANPQLMTTGNVLHPNAGGYLKMAQRWQADLVGDRVVPSGP